MNYDYLLAVGPGRSGTDLLYSCLKRSPDMAFPEIKEGYYYRSPRRFRRARRRAGGRMLADLSNLAYGDPRLAGGVRALSAEGVRILLAVTVREHRDRALSMLRFRASRGLIALPPRRRHEEAVVADRLRGEQLRGIFGLGADVLVIRFPVLASDPQAAADAIASVCGVPAFRAPARRGRSPPVRARFPPLALAGRLAAVALRRLGLRRTLQWLKDREGLQRMFFAPAADGDPAPRLSDGAAAELDAASRECEELIRSAASELREGIAFRPRAGRPAG